MTNAQFAAERKIFEQRLLDLGVPFRVIIRTNRVRLDAWLTILVSL